MPGWFESFHSAIFGAMSSKQSNNKNNIQDGKCKKDHSKDSKRTKKTLDSEVASGKRGSRHSNNTSVNGLLDSGFSSSSPGPLSNHVNNKTEPSKSRPNHKSAVNSHHNHVHHSNHEKRGTAGKNNATETMSAGSPFKSSGCTKSSGKSSSPSPSPVRRNKTAKAKDKEKDRSNSKSKKSAELKLSSKDVSPMKRRSSFSSSKESHRDADSQHRSHHRHKHSHHSSSSSSSPSSASLHSSSRHRRESSSSPSPSRVGLSTRVKNLVSPSNKSPSKSSSSKSSSLSNNVIKQSPHKSKGGDSSSKGHSRTDKATPPRRSSTQSDSSDSRGKTVTWVEKIPSSPMSPPPPRGKAAMKGPKSTMQNHHRSDKTESHLSSYTYLSTTHCVNDEDYRREYTDFVNGHDCNELVCPTVHFDNFEKIQSALELRCVQLERNRLRLKGEKKAYAKLLKNIPKKKKDRTHKDTAAYFLKTFKGPVDYESASANSLSTASNASKSNPLFVGLKATNGLPDQSSISLISQAQRKRQNSCSEKSVPTTTPLTDPNFATRPGLLLSSISTATMLSTSSGPIISDRTKKKAERHKALLEVVKLPDSHVYSREVNLRYELFNDYCRQLFGGDLSAAVHLEPLQKFLDQASFLGITNRMVELKDRTANDRSGTFLKGSPEGDQSIVIKREVEEESLKRSTRSLSRNHSMDQLDSFFASITSPQINGFSSSNSSFKRKRKDGYDLPSTMTTHRNNFLNGYKVPRINGALRSNNNKEQQQPPPPSDVPTSKPERRRSRSPSSLSLNKTPPSQKLITDIMNDHMGVFTRRGTQMLAELVEPNEAGKEEEGKSKTLLRRGEQRSREDNKLRVQCHSKYKAESDRMRQSIQCSAQLVGLLNEYLTLFAPDCNSTAVNCTRAQLTQRLLPLPRNDSTRSATTNNNSNVVGSLSKCTIPPSSSCSSRSPSTNSSPPLPPPSTPVPRRRGRKSQSSCNSTPLASNSPRTPLSTTFPFSVPTTRGRKRSYAESMESDASEVDEHSQSKGESKLTNGFVDAKEDPVDAALDLWNSGQSFDCYQKPRNYAQVMESFQLQQQLDAATVERSLNVVNLSWEHSSSFSTVLNRRVWCSDLEKEQPMLKTDPIGFNQSGAKSIHSVDPLVDGDSPIKSEIFDVASNDVDSKDSLAEVSTCRASSDPTMNEAIQQLSLYLDKVTEENKDQIDRLAHYTRAELENQELRTPIVSKHIDVADAMSNYLQAVDPRTREKEGTKVSKKIADMIELKDRQTKLLEQMNTREAMVRCWHFPRLNWVNGRQRSELDFTGDFYDQ